MKPCPEEKHIIILDGHHSHKTLAAVEYARAHGIDMVTLPPHCTHKMQPLDRTLFKALKSGYNLAADTWMVANPGKRITFFEMAGIFTTAYNKSATIEKAVNGFRVCGLWPFNDQIFDEEDFIAAGVTEEPSPAAGDIHQNEGNLEGNRDPRATMGIPFEPPDGKENNLMLNEIQWEILGENLHTCYRCH